MTTVSLRPDVRSERIQDVLLRGLLRALGRLRNYVYAHRISLFVLLPVMAVTSVIRLWNFTGTPATWNDDEGTYVAQAYAVLHYGSLAHYTYWYDHPPFGWIQIAGYMGLTNALARYSTAILAGREFVAVCGVVSGVLIYILCRQLKIVRSLSVLAVVLFMVSPIALFYGKMVFLDNIMVPWFLASLVFAVAAGKRHSMSILSGLCFAGAFLTKETVLPFAAGVVALIVFSSGKGFRLKNTVIMLGTLVMAGVLMYVLLAALKGELFPGKGHVSLIGAILWQLFTRVDSGPLLAHNSTFMSWLDIDKYLLFVSLSMMAVAALKRRFWPIVGLGVVAVGLIVRGGYLPSPFVIVLLPIGALIIAAGTQALWEGWAKYNGLSILTKVMAVLFVAVFVVQVGPFWQQRARETFGSNGIRTEQQAINWITTHSPSTARDRIVVDENIWMDLINRGYNRSSVDWFYKIDADPAVQKRYLPADGDPAGTWKSIDYIVIPDIGATIINSVPTMKSAIQHSEVVANFGGKGFGSYYIYKINHQGEK